MYKFITAVVSLSLLAACQQSPVLDEESPRSRIAPGSVLVLHEPLSVPVGHARVFLQDGKVRAKRRIDMYYPHCNFELRTLSDAPQTIHPGRFTIKAIRWNEEMVVEHGPARPYYTDAGSGDVSVSLITRLLQHRLEAPQQPELMRLTCHGGFAEPWRAQFPSVAQIRQVLGELATIEAPDMQNLRLIVQFAEGVDPSEPDYLERLGGEITATLTLRRQLRGGLAVLSVQGEGTEEGLMSRLGAHPDVVNIQRDSLARPQ